MLIESIIARAAVGLMEGANVRVASSRDVGSPLRASVSNDSSVERRVVSGAVAASWAWTCASCCSVIGSLADIAGIEVGRPPMRSSSPIISGEMSAISVGRSGETYVASQSGANRSDSGAATARSSNDQLAPAGTACEPISSSSEAGASRPARYVADSPPPNSARTSNAVEDGIGRTCRSAGANGDDDSWERSPHRRARCRVRDVVGSVARSNGIAASAGIAPSLAPESPQPSAPRVALGPLPRSRRTRHPASRHRPRSGRLPTFPVRSRTGQPAGSAGRSAPPPAPARPGPGPSARRRRTGHPASRSRDRRC